MSYRTLLVHLDSSARSAVRVRLAAQLAVRLDAHLVGVAPTGNAAGMFGAAGDGFSRAGALHSDKELRMLAEEATATFRTIVRGTQVSSFEAYVEDAESAAALALHARFADLVVVGQRDPDHPIVGVGKTLVEDVIELSPRPVLVVPYAGDFTTLGERVAVAWSAARESARAIADALPLLRDAREVRVLTFNPQGPGAEAAATLSGLGGFLSRHGVHVELTCEDTPIDTGSALLSSVCDYGCDLIVMGAFGHSRLREALLGGVTQTLLDHMTVPVLMSR